MTKNPILDELRAVREQMLADAGGTLDGLVDRLQAEEKQSDRTRYDSQPVTQPTTAKRPGDLPIENLVPSPDDR